MSSSGYLDDVPELAAAGAGSGSGNATSTETMRSRTELLMAHMNNQPWHRRIRPSTHDDDVESDGEMRRRSARHGTRRRRRRQAGAGSSDDDDTDETSTSSSVNSFSTWDSEEEERRAQQEWDESVAQLQLALQVMVLPYFGKFFGRRWSYWAFARYQQHGLTAKLFGLDWLWAPTTIVPSAAVAALQP